MKKPELMIPASSLEVLKTAVTFGADAVYIGGEVFSLLQNQRLSKKFLAIVFRLKQVLAMLEIFLITF